MNNSVKAARIVLLRELLMELAETEKQLEQHKTGIENMSSRYFQEILKEKDGEIQHETEKYRSNTDRLAAIKLEITSGVNLWYEFRKSRNEMTKLLFPLIFSLKRRGLQKKIKKLNDEVSSIIIDNRMIKEKLTLFEHQLEIAALEKARASMEYQLYDQMLSKKDSIISELEYLLPTIPGLCPANIGASEIDELLRKLATFEAA